tara:strand:+ start:602 stop:829 length:228 start_codon:yes stop_codon:yes gene_type:complete
MYARRSGKGKRKRQGDNEMILNNHEIKILLELLKTALDNVGDDLNQEGLSDHGATVLSERHNALYRIKRSLEVSP